MILRLATACLVMVAIPFTATPAVSRTDVRLPSVFSNHMVLQRDMPVPVWGWAGPGEKVEVIFDDQTKTTQADDDGHWRVNLDPLTVGKPRSLVVEGNNSRIEIKDILVGEVWLCSGQSNMQWAVSQCQNGDLELLEKSNGNLRFLTVNMVGEQAPQDDFDGAWETDKPGTRAQFSAVGYFFGSRLEHVLGVPIGLIDNSWGGSACESWVPLEKLAENSMYKPLLTQWKREADGVNEEALRTEFAATHAIWKDRMKSAIAAGKPIPKWTRPTHKLLTQQRPANMYNGEVVPLQPFAIRGVIWYQGEFNAPRAQQYRELFPLMIESWREAWGQGDFPFYWVQLADYRAEKSHPSNSQWAELREAQTMTLDRLPNTGEAVIIDAGNGIDIHPRDKQTVGDRLARIALARDYEYDIPYQSPRHTSVEIKGSKVLVTFDHCRGGLKAKDTTAVHGFDLIEEGGKWVRAHAEIVNGTNQVVVSSDNVNNPIAVRYAWGDNPVCNLYTNAGIPVTPFRSQE